MNTGSISKLYVCMYVMTDAIHNLPVPEDPQKREAVWPDRPTGP